MGEWRRIVIDYELFDGMDDEAIAITIWDCADELLDEGTWTSSSDTIPDPDPECTCGPQPNNGQTIRSDCPKHAAGQIWNAA
jgi:hypothetical protein